MCACDGCSHKQRIRLIRVPHSTTNSSRMTIPIIDDTAPIMKFPIIIVVDDVMTSSIACISDSCDDAVLDSSSSHPKSVLSLSVSTSDTSTPVPASIVFAIVCGFHVSAANATDGESTSASATKIPKTAAMHCSIFSSCICH